MASKPPQFQVEDQTDEDFFDNLVNEDDDFSDPNKTATTSPHKSAASNSIAVDSNDSDYAKAFSNLSIDESGIDSKQNIGKESIAEKKSELDYSKQNIGTESIAENKGESDDSFKKIESNSILDNKSNLSAASAIEPSNKSDVKDVLELESVTDSVDNSSGSVVKEVGWSSFYADSTEQNGNHGFGSYSDFFTDLGENSVEFPGKVEENVNVARNANGGANNFSGNQESKPYDVIQNSFDYGNYGQYQESPVYGAEKKANGHDLNSSEYWESLYPGWKYDMNTGQWCHVDATSGQQGCSDTASRSDWNVISEKLEVSYLNQSVSSVVGTVMETSATESVSNWNSQVSQGDNNGYLEHMIFDPQYPGWYYDTIVQEWRLLENYNLSEESTGQAHGQQSQNGFPSGDTYLDNTNSLYGEFPQGDNYGSKHDGNQNLNDKQGDNYGSQGLINLNQHGGWAESYDNYSQQGFNMWQPETIASTTAVSNLGRSQQVDNLHGSNVSVNNHVNQPNTFSSTSSIPSYNHASQGHGQANGISGFQSFVPSSGDYNKQLNPAYVKQNEQMQLSNDFYGSQKHGTVPRQSFQSGYQNSYAPNIGRSSAGRPPHALVTFGFGGKLVVMKENSCLKNSAYGNQVHVGGSISVLNMMEVVMGNTDASGIGSCAYDYFRALCQQSFPGPLVGGNTGSRELNKWIDERIANCESPDLEYRKGEILKLLLSLLKIGCQHYGKLRSPFGTDTILRESDTPESAVAKLFASAKRNSTQYGVLNQCLVNLPSEGQSRATASEVQNLLVSGRKKEALLCAQEGQLWGPALILASQLGEQFYIDTVKQMALRQLAAGSPLRTLCLLIAGQPADVFSTDMLADSGLPRAVNTSQQPTNFGVNGMLDDWEENLAVITANRTKDDELVIIHLGDCLWKDRSEITAAHICYLVAEANFESYSDTARLCLIGADHWKFPRTYSSPEAIQRTELYEYSKVLGNSQFILLPFQPYKLIYAYMLAEVGKVSDSLKYCQALLKSLKTGRGPEVETWKQLVLSLDERIRIHQQGGYAANLAPAKLVGKLLNFFDSTAHRAVGGLPPPAPSTFQGSGQGNEQYSQHVGPRVLSSQSTMAMSSLMPSASMEPIREWAADGNRMTMSNKSASEPDFGRTPRQVDSSMEATSSSAAGKPSGSGGMSRFSRFGFGSGLLQKTVGLVLRPRSDKQAKLGEKNKFYYDEKLKRWVEEGAEPPAEEAALPPPPTATAFQTGTSDYNLQSALKSDNSSSNGSPIIKSTTPAEHSSGVPPFPTSTNQFSAHGRMGVRSRYVDTFNQGKRSPAKSFQSPSVPTVKPAAAAKAKFFVPAPASSAEQPMEAIAENAQEENATYEKPSTSTMNDSIKSPAASMTKQRFPSMDNIPGGFMTNGNSSHSLHAHSRRTASWSGSFTDASNRNMTETNTLGEAIGMPPSSFMPSTVNGGSFGDELHEVEL